MCLPIKRFLWSMYHIGLVVGYGISGPNFRVPLVLKGQHAQKGIAGTSLHTHPATQELTITCHGTDDRDYG